MKLSINFLSQHRKELTTLEIQDKKYYKISLGVAIFTSAVAAVVVGTSFFLHFNAEQALARKTVLEADISNQQDVERSALILSSKVGALSSLIDLRTDKQEAISYFTQLFGNQVLIKDIDYQSVGAVLSLRIESESVFAFNEAVALLENAATLEQFASIAKSDLTRARNGSYSITLTVVLNSTE